MFLLVLTSSNVSAIASYCGDSYCDNGYAEYNESNPAGAYYCPMDCGILVNSDWCKSTYDLRTLSECPTCPICGSATISSISSTDLNNWCSTNGYSKTSSPSDSTNKYYWIIFLAIGAIAGYMFARRKK